MNLAQTIDQETLRSRDQGVSTFSAIASLFVSLAERAPKRKIPVASDPESIKPGSARAVIYDLIQKKGRPMTYPEIKDALAKKIGVGNVKTTLFNMVECRVLVRTGFCKHYRYGVPKEEG